MINRISQICNFIKTKFASEKGEIGDSLIIIIAIGLGAVLMFVFPLMSLSERTDDISQLAVQTATDDFVDEVRTTGKLTLASYEKYLQTVSATGNSFEPEIVVYQLDENPGSKTYQAEMTKIGENVYYAKYTSQVIDELNKTGKMRLKEGDRISVKVKNTNQTIAQLLRNFFYQVAGDSTADIAASKAAIVTVNGSN